ncbi:MAG: DUF4012 domain-containing protein, partial [Candidatus Spechtbacterales bacterium]|nr:DUF4012 domain-containing protein [Candidatus Spechtbacterales bacterium]
MTDSSYNSNKDSKKPPKKGGIWRKHLYSEVVDLRAEFASEEEIVQQKNRELASLSTKTVRDIDPVVAPNNSDQNVEKNILGKAIDERFSASLIKKSSDREKNFTDPESGHKIPSKEELYEELSALYEEDLRIEEDLVKKKNILASTDANSNDHEEEESLEEDYNETSKADEQIYENNSHTGISLIPKKQQTPQTPLEDRDVEPAESPAEKESSIKLSAILSSILPKKKKPILVFSSNQNKSKKIALRKAITVFSLLCIISLAGGGMFSYFKLTNLKETSETQAKTAYSYMRQGKDSLLNMDAAAAEDNFLKAKKEFQSIENEFGFLGKDLIGLAASLPVQSSVGSMAHLFRAGTLYADAGYEASVAFGLIQNASPGGIGGEGNDQGLTDNIVQAGLHLQRSREYITEANTELSFARPEDIPQEFQSDIHKLQSEAGNIEQVFEETFSSLDVVLSFMGHKEPKKYMLAFQNSGELRATGGFIGSYGILDLHKGNVEELFVDGIYNPDGQLKVKEFFVVPPKPLQYVTPHWGTRDANWFYDFPTSAEKIMDFYVHTGGAKTDGVIAITPKVVLDFLRLAGPIDMPEYGVTLDADNFLELVQQEVEEDYDKELNRPKKILADMAPILFERLSTEADKMDLLDIMLEGLERKDILVYSRDVRVQESILSRNWGGSVDILDDSTDTINDYLAVVISNIGGWKTDKYTETEIDTVTIVNKEGELIRTILLSRTHNGGRTGYKWYDKPNYGYIRIYTPKGSELLSVEGFSEEPSYIETDYEEEGYRIDPDVSAIEKTLSKHESGTDVFEEAGKTVFGNWLYIPAQDRKIAKVTYKLPYNISSNISSYNLKIQKQSGLTASYSGSIEELNDNLSFDSCKFNDNERFTRDFRFTQDSDR